MSQPDPPIEGMQTHPYGLPLMREAWWGCITWAASEESVRAQFKKDTGLDLDNLLHASPLDQMIDKSTGHGRAVCIAWLDWVTKNMWGEEESQHELHE